MAVKQSAAEISLKFPQAAAVVEKSFNVDDGLTGADSNQEAIDLQKQLHSLFEYRKSTPRHLVLNGTLKLISFALLYQIYLPLAL